MIFETNETKNEEPRLFADHLLFISSHVESSAKGRQVVEQGANPITQKYRQDPGRINNRQTEVSHRATFVHCTSPLPAKTG
jgi:cytosine/adenosine deaminase-related metal-dependent hydrolase